MNRLVPVFEYIDEWSGGGAWVICCPVCQMDYQHHGGVVVFSRERGEDGPTIVNGVFATDEQLDAGNPSSRRGAVRIHFDGECEHSWWLDIVQHKGQTFMFAGSNDEVTE